MSKWNIEIAEQMMGELEKDPAFLPSEFWSDINKKNIAMLDAEGIENFKRTLSQNYYNWLITYVRDPQFINGLLRWLSRPTLRPFQTKIEENITLRLITGDKPVTLNAKQRFIYSVFVGLVWETMLANDKAGLHKNLCEPETGNPIHIWDKSGRLITQDIANSVLECNIIADLTKDAAARPRVAEVGAGYGRLAYVYARTQPGTYFIFDIPPALHVTQWYLTETLKDKKIFKFRSFNDFSDIEKELEDADIALFSANQIEKFPPGYFNVMLSISTLPEMSPEQARMYLDIFNRYSREYVYLKQWKVWKNPLDGTDFRIEDYLIGDQWNIVADRIDPINPLFFNRVWKKIS